MNFGSYNMDRNFIRRGILVWDILNKKDENSESKNLFNQKILDSILDDDDSKFTELVSQIVDEDPKSSHRFSMTNYKFPKILSSNPTYASLCAFFNSEKCFSALTLLCPEGITSEKFQQLDDENRSIIHFACSGGSLNIIRELYEAGFDLNTVDCDGLYPSHYSAMAGTTDVMKYLWTKGANILTNDRNVMTPLQVACLYGNLDIVKFICEKVDENDQVLNDSYQYFFFNKITPLHLACEGGHSKIVDYILSKEKFAKKQIFEVDNELRTPLAVACQNGSLECVKSIVNSESRKKFDIDEQIHLSIIDAAEGGHIDIVKYFLQQEKIDLNKANSNKLTALEVAVLNGHLKIIDLLIQNGAAQNKTKKEIGDLFLSACGVYNNNNDIINYLDSHLKIPYETMGEMFVKQACRIESRNLVNFLISKNCSLKGIAIDDVNFRIKWTPFMTFLKEKGFDFSHICSKNGHPIIIKTITTGSINSVKEMISEGIDLNKDIIEEHDLVFFACLSGKIDLFFLLISYNPKIKEPNKCLNQIIINFIKSKSKRSKKQTSLYLKAIETLLNVYKADPNDENSFKTSISYCSIELLDLLFKYSTKFDSCHIDYQVFASNDYKNTLSYLKVKNFDIDKIYCENENPLIIHALELGNFEMFDVLIGLGVKFDKDLIDQYNLVDKAIGSIDLKMFTMLLKYNPTINDSTLLYKKIFTENHLISLVHFNKEQDAIKIAEILINDFNANANEELVIEFATSNHLMNVLTFLAKYGVDFNNCCLDYSRMITSKHLPVFELLENNGCTFSKAKAFKVKKTYLSQNFSNNEEEEKNDNNQNYSPICVNLLNTYFYKYDYRTFLFLLKYSTNEEIINFRKKKKSIFPVINYTEGNVIDVLFNIECFDGILEVYKKVKKVIFPLLVDNQEFLFEIRNRKNQELIDIVAGY